MTGAPKTANPAQRREESVLLAASLANGPVELLDFLLPLWAGAALGASPAQVGLLVAVELAVSVVARPLAGVLADRAERRYIAAAGALVYALACSGYAVATSLPIAYVAAALGGVGGALLWVSVRAMIGERLAEDTAVYPRLSAAEETGAWVAFVAGLALLGAAGYRTVFLACGGACLLAAVALLGAPRRVAAPAPPVPGSIVRRLRPMLLGVAVTMAAEAGIGLLLLMHLQRDFDLEVVQIAYVFLPGAVAMAVLPVHLHRFVLRVGRGRALAVASLASATFAAGLAWAPNPVVIAALWVLSGVAWAAVIPIQQAVIAEASGDRVGRGMGLYESAVLLGSMAGSLAAGALYEVAPWPIACLAAAAVVVSGAAIVPWSLRALGVADKPAGASSSDLPVQALEAERSGRVAAQAPLADRGGVSEADPPAPDETEPDEMKPDEMKKAGNPRSRFGKLGEHAALYLVAQVALAVFGLSWLVDLATGAVDLQSGERDTALAGSAEMFYNAGRIWTVVLVVDVIWTAVTVLSRKPKNDEE
ncbi:MFS transporter [Krasilnikovia sp. M28-CT-15]|uniref:MFS transporter n=1 Tax=Krasilnikovia sp. M28-CT-15 TaxID=3373540 RepID=UPI003876388E